MFTATVNRPADRNESPTRWIEPRIFQQWFPSLLDAQPTDTHCARDRTLRAAVAADETSRIETRCDEGWLGALRGRELRQEEVYRRGLCVLRDSQLLCCCHQGIDPSALLQLSSGGVHGRNRQGHVNSCIAQVEASAGSQARSTAQRLGRCPIGVRRFESGPAHR